MEQKTKQPGGRRNTSPENGKAGGRPSTGRKRFVAYITDEEREGIYRAVPRLRKNEKNSA